MTINVGDWVRVPKGTNLIKDYTKGNYGEGKEPTSREVTVQVSAVTDIDSYYLRSLLSLEDFSAYQAELRKFPNPNTHGGQPGQYTDETRARDRAGQEAALVVARSKIPNGATQLIHWSNDKKAALNTAVEKVEAPAPRKKPEVKINKRQQMVNKSRWKFTETRAIMGIVESPNYWPAIHKVNADPNFERPDWDHKDQKASSAANATWQARREAEIARLCPEGQYIEAVIYQATAGEIIEVEGKFQKSWSGKNGDIFVAKLENGSTTRFPYKSVEPYIEAETIPTVDIYVLRNKASSEFYKSSEYNATATKAAQDAATLRGEKLYGIWHEHAVYEPVTVEAFMKAKHFDGLGRAKTQILMMTGYYNNLPGADESLPEWAGGSGFQLDTAEWELVHFDKLARKEVGVVSDFAEWYKRAWELRELTVRYGSSVRTAYKALEKANLLDSQKGMVVFTETDEEKLDNVGYHGDKTAISDEEKALIDAAIASTQMKKGTFKKAVDIKSVAVTFPNKGAAMMFKLAYNGKLKTTILDLETLTEAVDG